MLSNSNNFPTSTLKCLLENTELADLLFNSFPLLEDEQNLKSDKQLISNELSSKVGWNSSAFLGPNLWDKDQLYSASGNGLNVNSTTLHNNEKNLNSTTNSNSNFKVENIDIDEFLCENNLNLNDIESFSNHFENVEQPTSNSPNTNQDNLILNSPMQAAPAKSPNDDSISRQSSSSSRKYSQDETSTKTGNSKQFKKNRKAQHLSKQFVPDELKDEKYWARRRKNNLAAKRSRDARRMKENQIALRADFLERESDQLKKQMEDLKRENQKLKMKLIQYESKIQQ
jgi:leukemia factor-related protein